MDKEIGKPILRISLSLVFLYFGISQIISPGNWAGFIPSFLSNWIFSANNLVVFNGILEITLGLFLIMGLYTKFSSFVLSIHLFFIALSMGFSPLGVRDLGLSLATFVVFLNGIDRYCLDRKFRDKTKIFK